MLSDLIDSPDALAVFSSPEVGASASPPESVDQANVVESLDNIRASYAVPQPTYALSKTVPVRHVRP